MGRPREKVSDIQRYYSANGEQTRFLTHQLEYLVTSQILAYYLKGHSSILELGAGPGTYTLELASAGHNIVTTDFSETLIAQSRQLLKENALDERVRFIVADARDIEKHVSESFDAITVFGPLYHLSKPAERADLLRSCFRLLKPEGIVFTAQITRLGLIAQTLARHPETIARPNSGLEEIWKKGHLKSHPRDGSFRGYFTTLEEIAPFHQTAGLEVMSLHAQDPGIGAADEIFNRLPPELKMPWATLLFTLSSDVASLGSGRHIICVARKPASPPKQGERSPSSTAR